MVFATYQKEVWGASLLPKCPYILYIVITQGKIWDIKFRKENIKFSIFSGNIIIYMKNLAESTSNQGFPVFWNPSQVIQEESNPQNLKW